MHQTSTLRHSSGGQPSSFSPLATNSSNGGADEEEEDYDEEEEEDDDENEDEQTADGKKRKRSEDTDTQAKGKKKGKPAETSNGQEETGADGKKPKPTRGAKACKNCRRLKMRCIVSAESGPPCDRCKNTSHACIFEESHRGKRSGKTQKTEVMAASLRKMEATMNSLIKSLQNDPSTAFNQGAGMVTRSPSPSRGRDKRWPPANEVDELGRAYGAIRDAKTRLEHSTMPAASPGGNHIDPKILGSKDSDFLSNGLSTSDSIGTSTHTTRFVEPALPPRSVRQVSPRLHSLPDNTLNPLGLLAEASLHNSMRTRKSSRNRGTFDGRSTAGSVSSHGENESPLVSAKMLSQGEDASTSSTAGKGATVQDAGDEHLPGTERANDGTNPSITTDAGTPGSGIHGEERYHLGVASEAYFKPGPMTILPLRRIVIERELAPELLTQGIITSQEVLELFQVFFHHCSQHIVLLDPEWHTPTMICGRSPFLFTVICTIAAKFYAKRPELHLKCLQVVRKSAYMVMSRGWKSVEIVQAFMLLTLWNTPAERFEEDKTWLFSGVAIRMATDLNLHRKSVASVSGHQPADDPAVLEREREILNRERTWLVCFSIDRSISGQMGKPWTIREDWIIRNSRHWCLQRLSQPYDMGICGLVELLRLTSRQLDLLYSSTTSISGLNTDLDYANVLHIFNEQLDEWHAVWQARGFFTSPHDRQNKFAGFNISKEEEAAAESLRSANTPIPPADDEDHQRRTLHFLTKQAPIRYNYAVLILNSFGLQHAVDFPLRSGLDKGVYFSKCLQAAKNIVLSARDGLKPVLAYSPDTLFVIISYACVFLLKLIRPTFSSCVDEESVLAVVTEGAELLESVAMNPTHTPALYASFLRALLQSRLDRTNTNRSGATTPHRSRPVSPQNGGDMNEGEADMVDKVEQEEVPYSTPAMPASVFSSLGRSMGGSNATNWTAEQAALLNGHGAQSSANMSVDQLLNESFWGSLLPPGFGGPLDGLATGSVEMFPSGNQYGGTASMAPSNNITRANSPSLLHHFGPQVAFDFSSGSLS
jgi:hypothetical protein